IALLKSRTVHDFTLYKPGTLERRIARRMDMAGIAENDTSSYLAMLQNNEKERNLLAEDLLINVTSFFRDPSVFEILAATVIPELVSGATEQPLRIWVAGCSTGEETYSLAMLFLEQIKAKKSTAKIQIFASDVDAKAVLAAREGLYSAKIEETVSAARLSRFFIKVDHGYRVSQELRACIVFAVQDVLADPPFSKLDMVSCRNLLIYLRPEAQAKIISVFNFALHEGGFLLLGAAETVGAPDGRFTAISKVARLYHKTGGGGEGHLPFYSGDREPVRAAAHADTLLPAVRKMDIAETCQKLVLELYGPASVMINRRRECLYTSGQTDQYLRVAPGYPTHDLLALIQPALRTRLKIAIDDASTKKMRVSVPGGRVVRNGQTFRFNIDVQPVPRDSDKLLVSFIDQAKPEPKPEHKAAGTPASANAMRVTELKHELEATRAELQIAIRSLEISGEEQNALNEEALSVNEEYQSTNEELLTSKEELQSLNEELTALNSQLQETLERSRTTLNDLQNVLYSTNVATLFLDANMNIRFFTPATKSLFTIIHSDLGRPLADLRARANDPALLADAHAVLENSEPIECEVQTEDGSWFTRRILPYLTHEGAVNGVVVTFVDITERKTTAAALGAAQREAERANQMKSRFLAAASHDLRQPLQTLALIGGLLSKMVAGKPAYKLVVRLEQTLDTMSEILNALLDINQIDAGIVSAKVVCFPVNELLAKLQIEFADSAKAAGVALRIMPCSWNISTDPRLLGQMVRNLLSNALKYTKKGRVLIGCRTKNKVLRIEIWDTGIGIAPDQLQQIFEEYHQVDNPNHERRRGLGLGLSIVQRLGELLGHHVSVRSQPGMGSVFTIEVPACDKISQPMIKLAPAPAIVPSQAAEHLTGKILVIEDDVDIRQLLKTFLTEEGYRVAVTESGSEALPLVTSGGLEPDLILADYNLADHENGLTVAIKLRGLLKRQVPVIIMTGDISAQTFREIAEEGCMQMNKPMKLAALTDTIQAFLTAEKPHATASAVDGKDEERTEKTTVFVVDDDAGIRASLCDVFEAAGRFVECFASCEDFLRTPRSYQNACLLVDAKLPGMSGLDLLRNLTAAGHHLPAIMITGQGDVKMAVQAMQAGALDFIEKPVSYTELLARVANIFDNSKNSNYLAARREEAERHFATLTTRQREIMDMVLAGMASKNIAATLGISQRTVENHRAAIMAKTGIKSIPALARLAMLMTDEKRG
ncbi:MAG TPA: CheR family methyltransferase, partial [Acidocella sp.]|nr:CheR family methyltransferase [Acidocella sp.]